MGIIAVPVTFADGVVLTAADLNAAVTAIYGEFNGNIDDTNIKAGANIDGSKFLNASIPAAKLIDTIITDAKLDYTSVKLVRAGPNFAGGANGKRLAAGLKAFTLVGGFATVTVTFSSDSVDGDPAFVAAPIFTGMIEHSSVANAYDFQIVTPVLASSITIRIRSILTTGTPGATDGADNSSGTLHWHALGDV